MPDRSVGHAGIRARLAPGGWLDARAFCLGSCLRSLTARERGLRSLTARELRSGGNELVTDGTATATANTLLTATTTASTTAAPLTRPARRDELKRSPPKTLIRSDPPVSTES